MYINGGVNNMFGTFCSFSVDTVWI